MLRSKKTHRTLSPREAAAAHSQGELVLVDVRESAERAVEHIAGALHILLAQVPRRLPELPRDTPVAFVCRSGRRSAAAAATAGKGGVDAAKLDIDEYLRLARYLGVRIEHILETHNHADHVSGHGRLAAASGAVICGSGQRSAVAASLLQRYGAQEVIHVVEGGVPLWKRQSWSTEQPRETES